MEQYTQFLLRSKAQRLSPNLNSRPAIGRPLQHGFGKMRKGRDKKEKSLIRGEHYATVLPHCSLE